MVTISNTTLSSIMVVKNCLNFKKVSIKFFYNVFQLKTWESKNLVEKN